MHHYNPWFVYFLPTFWSSGTISNQEWVIVARIRYFSFLKISKLPRRGGGAKAPWAPPLSQILDSGYHPSIVHSIVTPFSNFYIVTPVHCSESIKPLSLLHLIQKNSKILQVFFFYYLFWNQSFFQPECPEIPVFFLNLIQSQQTWQRKNTIRQFFTYVLFIGSPGD